MLGRWIECQVGKRLVERDLVCGGIDHKNGHHIQGDRVMRTKNAAFLPCERTLSKRNSVIVVRMFD